MKLASFEYRDPGQVVIDVAARHPLIAGDALLALVREPSRRQQVVHVSRLTQDQWAGLGRYERSELLYDTVHTMPVPERRCGAAPRHSIMTIVARPGIAVLGRHEAEWLTAWRYSNHLTDAFAGDLILVTEHGWTDFMTGWGRHEPRLECGSSSPTSSNTRSAP